MEATNKKYVPPKNNKVYDVDGVAHGVDEAVLAEIKQDVERRINAEELGVPALPTVASKILQVSNDPDAGIAEIERLVRTDQFLAGKVLGLVNSAFYAGRQRVSSLKQAVSLLGLRTLRDVVFSISMHQKVFRADRYTRLMEENWAHSVAAATAASAVAERLKIERESAFLSGLLHDIGRPVLLHSIIEIEENLLDGKELGVDTIEVLVTDFHELVGGYVGTRWQLAPNVIESVRHHHHPDRSREHHVLTSVVYCGDKISDHLGFGRSEPQECDFTLDPVFVELEMVDEELLRSVVEATSAQATGFLSAFTG